MTSSVEYGLDCQVIVIRFPAVTEGLLYCIASRPALQHTDTMAVTLLPSGLWRRWVC
jgi:hypothetical protein